MVEYIQKFKNIYESNRCPYGTLFNQYGKRRDPFDHYQPNQGIEYKW